MIGGRIMRMYAGYEISPCVKCAVCMDIKVKLTTRKSKLIEERMSTSHECVPMRPFSAPVQCHW
jgi:hypothetical protein